MKLQQVGYHATKLQAERFVAIHPEKKLEVKPYPDRHGEYRKEADHGVWNITSSHWEYIELPIITLNTA